MKQFVTIKRILFRNAKKKIFFFFQKQMFQFLEDLEHIPNHDIDNELKFNTQEIQQLKEEVQQLKEEAQLNTQVLQEIKEMVNKLWKDHEKPMIQDVKKIKKPKTISKRPKAEIYNITTLSHIHSLTLEEAETTEILAICFANLFLKQKTNNTCFVVCIFFYWLCCFDWNTINEFFLNDCFSLLSSLNIVKNTIPTQELWKQIKNLYRMNPNRFSIWLPDIPQTYSGSIGTICHQIYFLDYIRTIENTQMELISEWCFTYLCVCVFESGTYIRDAARLTLLSIIRSSERIPLYVFDNEIVFNLLKRKINSEDVVVSLFLNILFKLHKFRDWTNFFQTYTNVLIMLDLIPPLIKTKENRKLVKFRLVIQKLKKTDF